MEVIFNRESISNFGRKLRVSNLWGVFVSMLAVFGFSDTSIVKIDFDNFARLLGSWEIEYILNLVYRGGLILISASIVTIIYYIVSRLVGGWLEWKFLPPKVTFPPDDLIRISLVELGREEKNKDGWQYRELEIKSIYPDGDLQDCYVVQKELRMSQDGKLKGVIESIARELPWSKSNARVSGNKLDLVLRIPAKLTLIRVNPKKKKCEMVGVNEQYTPIEEGDYALSLIFESSNFSTRIFYVNFFYDGEGNLEITHVDKKGKFLETISDVEFSIDLDMKANAKLQKQESFFVWFKKTVLFPVNKN